MGPTMDKTADEVANKVPKAIFQIIICKFM